MLTTRQNRNNKAQNNVASTNAGTRSWITFSVKRQTVREMFRVEAREWCTTCRNATTAVIAVREALGYEVARLQNVARL